MAVPRLGNSGEGRKMFTGREGRLKGLLLVGCAVVGLGLPTRSLAQWKVKDTEWASYGADLAGTRYRPLEQINAANFNDLEIAWRIKTDNFGNRPEYKLEGTPLMVNGVVYATAGSRRAGRRARRRGAAAALRARIGVLVGRKRRAHFVCDAGLSIDLPGCEDGNARAGIRK